MTPAPRGLTINIAGGVELNEEGERILRRGGDDNASDDDMLLLEIVKRAPNMTIEDLQIVFMSTLEQYGEDALHAIRSGHIQFEKRTNGVGNA